MKNTVLRVHQNPKFSTLTALNRSRGYTDLKRHAKKHHKGRDLMKDVVLPDIPDPDNGNGDNSNGDD